MEGSDTRDIKIMPKPNFISWEEITELLHAAFSGKAEKGLKYLAAHQDVETTKKRVGDGICLVALVDGELAGTGTVHIKKVNPAKKKWHNENSYGYLVQLAVHPDFRGLGLGQRLLEERLNICHEHKVDEVVFDTSRHAKRLLSYWKKQGFQFVDLLSHPTTNYYSINVRKPIKGKKYSTAYAAFKFYQSALWCRLQKNKYGAKRWRLRKLLPKSIKTKLRSLKAVYDFRGQRKKEQALLKRASKKKTKKVAFFLLYESMWKYDRLYFLLKEDKRFDPVMFICPFKKYGDDIMHQEMENAYSSFKSKGYKVEKTLMDNGELLDVKNKFKPDLVFFTSPWNHTYPGYQIDNYLNTLTGYVNYSYTTSTLYQANYNKTLHAYCWTYFVESKIHQKIAKQHSRRAGENTMALGYAGLDNFIDREYKATDVWKPQEHKKKRIIWAPHHTIPGDLSERNLLDYGTFLDYADYMLKLTEDFKETIQIAFKPHPNLKGKLNQVWGQEKTEAYYKKWMDLPNGQLEEGEYIDLFLTSDAMVHDSGSFLIEYLYTHKPVLYIINNEQSKQQYNELGKKALDTMALAHKENDILSFIEKTVLNEKDLYSEKREQFFKEYLKPPNNKLASQNIYNFLVKELC